MAEFDASRQGGQENAEFFSYLEIKMKARTVVGEEGRRARNVTPDDLSCYYGGGGGWGGGARIINGTKKKTDIILKNTKGTSNKNEYAPTPDHGHMVKAAEEARRWRCPHVPSSPHIPRDAAVLPRHQKKWSEQIKSEALG